ncbi:MAG: TIGR00730 family Rossman fold protein [Hyphomicrobiaceae bacterium]|nr:TIGR00730 family Rossman fold protein [Hyphomicrobiaceae bacterium]
MARVNGEGTAIVPTSGKAISTGLAKGGSAANGGAAPSPSPLSRVCVYCGSGKGRNPKYAEAADILGHALASRGIGLVYGGGGLGLMGQVARATLDAGGHVTGIIPEFLLQKEHALDSASELIVTGDMHERKRLMFEKSDAFIALPGGIGTLEELVEQLTWAQLGRHQKPIILANIDGFWSPFLELLRHMKAETFIRSGLDVTFTVVDRAEQILTAAEQQVQAKPGDVLPDGVSIALF